MVSKVLVDSHCHVQFSEFDEDRDEVLTRAREVGLSKFVVVGTDIESSCQAMKLARSNPDIYATVGIHPHDASRFDSQSLVDLRHHGESSVVVAIGEIGLDYYRNFSPQNVQRQVFSQLLDLAAELRLPVVVHSREADEDMVEMLSAWANNALAVWPEGRPLGVMHSFGSDLEMALRYIDLGFLISIPATCTRPNSGKISAVAAGIPMSRMVVETDCPYQSPQSHRGRRNEPSYLLETVNRIAELRRVSPEDVAVGTSLAAAWLFDFKTKDREAPAEIRERL